MSDSKHNFDDENDEFFDQAPNRRETDFAKEFLDAYYSDDEGKRRKIGEKINLLHNYPDLYAQAAALYENLGIMREHITNIDIDNFDGEKRAAEEYLKVLGARAEELILQEYKGSEAQITQATNKTRVEVEDFQKFVGAHTRTTIAMLIEEDTYNNERHNDDMAIIGNFNVKYSKISKWNWVIAGSCLLLGLALFIVGAAMLAHGNPLGIALFDQGRNFTLAGMGVTAAMAIGGPGFSYLAWKKAKSTYELPGKSIEKVISKGKSLYVQAEQGSRQQPLPEKKKRLIDKAIAKGRSIFNQAQEDSKDQPESKHRKKKK